MLDGESHVERGLLPQGYNFSPSASKGAGRSEVKHPSEKPALGGNRGTISHHSNPNLLCYSRSLAYPELTRTFFPLKASGARDASEEAHWQGSQTRVALAASTSTSDSPLLHSSAPLLKPLEPLPGASLTLPLQKAGLRGENACSFIKTLLTA